MLIKKKTKKTPGTRHQLNLKKNILLKYNSIIKSLQKSINSEGGRNVSGRITVRHKGGSSIRKKVHVLNGVNAFYKAIVIGLFHNSRRSSLINLSFNLFSKTFLKTNSNENLYTGAIAQHSNLLESQISFRSSLTKFPIGSIISLISHKKAKYKYKFSSSAGCFCQILDKTKQNNKIKLPSGKQISLNNNYIASFGTVSNSQIKNLITGKAGRNRLKGRRPSVRGIAMNPVDHPHGGRSNKGMTPVTP